MIRKRGKGMHIAGLQKLSLLDYPGKVACTVFLSGCNLRCPYCHNAELISPHYAGEKISQTELMNFLDSRKEKIDGVCISGGEPTLTPELPELIKAIRKKGFFVKIDTNGTNPEMLKKLIEEKLVDYVAMDIKNSRIHYSEACGTEILPQIEESVHHLMNGNIDYEFRTTVCKPLHTLNDMKDIGLWLKGANRYFIQQFVGSGNVPDKSLSPFLPEELKQLKNAVLPYIPNTRVRGE